MSKADFGEATSYIRQEVYIGSNRCWLCTIFNTGLLLIVVATVGVLLGPFSGEVLMVIGLSSIWLRGYLVPYTPSLTSYLGDSLDNSLVSQHPVANSIQTDNSTDMDTTTNSDVVDSLLAADVLMADGEVITLTAAFRDAWRAEMETFRIYDLDTLATVIAKTVQWVAAASVVTDGDREWIRLTDEDENINNEIWITPAAAVADLTAIRVIDARTNLGVNKKTLAAPSLRQFLEYCPVCNEQLEVESPRGCCGSPRYVTKGIEAILACPVCEETITTFKAIENVD